MRKVNDSIGAHAFLVVGYLGDSNGDAVAGSPVHRTSSINRAREVCAALLWVEGSKFSALAIVDKHGKELARFRRFPPGRVREEVVDGVVVRDVGLDGRNFARGARLAISENGTRRKSFGGVK